MSESEQERESQLEEGDIELRDEDAAEVKGGSDGYGGLIANVLDR